MAGCSIKTDRAGRFEWNRTSLPDIDAGILISTDMVRLNGLVYTSLVYTVLMWHQMNTSCGATDGRASFLIKDGFGNSHS
jgi:hypothetical protein